MITKELLKKAFQNNVAQIVKDPDEENTVCQIGEYWFFFDINEDLPEEYMKNHTMEEVIDMTFEALEWLRKDGWDGLDEYNYYEAILREMK